MNTDGLTQEQIAWLAAQADQMRAENEQAEKWLACALNENETVVAGSFDQGSIEPEVIL